MSYSSTSTPQLSSDAPPPPPPKTHADLPQAVHPTSTPPVPPYKEFGSQYQSPRPGQDPPARPPRPPSHPALSYAESNPQSPPQVYESHAAPAELGGDESSNAAAVYAAGRRQGSIDQALTSQLPQPPSRNESRQQQPYRQQNPHAQAAPPPPDWVPEIVKNKTKSDLEHLLRTPSLLTALLHHPSTQPEILKTSNQNLQDGLRNISNLADQASQTATHVERERAKTQAQLLRTRGLEQTFRTRQHAHEDAIESFSPRALHRRLAQATREGEEELGVLVESFLGQEGTASERVVGDWVKGVRKAREKVELRRERGARWSEGRVGGWR